MLFSPFIYTFMVVVHTGRFGSWELSVSFDSQRELGYFGGFIFVLGPSYYRTPSHMGCKRLGVFNFETCAPDGSAGCVLAWDVIRSAGGYEGCLQLVGVGLGSEKVLSLSSQW